MEESYLFLYGAADATVAKATAAMKGDLIFTFDQDVSMEGNSVNELKQEKRRFIEEGEGKAGERTKGPRRRITSHQIPLRLSATALVNNAADCSMPSSRQANVWNGREVVKRLD